MFDKEIKRWNVHMLINLLIYFYEIQFGLHPCHQSFSSYSMVYKQLQHHLICNLNDSKIFITMKAPVALFMVSFK